MSMVDRIVTLINMDELQEIFGDRMITDAPMANLTTAQVGGPADGLISVHSIEELVETTSQLCKLHIPFIVLGNGSNVLVSDTGVRGVVIHNLAREVLFDDLSQPPTVWAASGANFGLLARMAVAKNLTGLEWAAGIPGTVGGAVVGNAGAHGSAIADNLILAEILHLSDESVDNKAKAILPKREDWPVERLQFAYRTSRIKRKPIATTGDIVLKRPARPDYIVLSALLSLEKSEKEIVREKIIEFTAYRRRTQTPGASMGSMFKNPPGDFAGRLIEAAGLKGMRVGQAEISRLHANFFVNLGGATASDIWELIQLASEQVKDYFGVRLELEVELIGDWDI